MKIHLFLSLLMAASAATVSAANPQPNWSYTGANDSAHWGDLSKDFAVCKTGKQQSPVDFTSVKAVKGKQVVYRYDTSDYKVENNGHTLQATPQGKPQTVMINGKPYVFKQFHFHIPSEHTFKGKHLPMEAHFVHQAEDGTLAVVATVFKPGKNNPALTALVAKKLKTGESMQLKGLDIQTLLPEDTKSFHLKGSLTTPPCSENVTWVVFETPVQAGEAQMKAMRAIIGSANNRPVQPLNGREVNEIQ